MTEQEMWDVINKKIEDRIGCDNKLMSYTEFVIDVLCKLVVDLSSIIDETKLTDEMKNEINAIKSLLQYSSIDCSTMTTNPKEGWKIPSAIKIKKTIREVQKPYLDIVLNVNE